MIGNNFTAVHQKFSHKKRGVKMKLFQIYFE